MLLDQKIFFVKEQVEFLKMAGTYDIFDPETNRQIAVAKEEQSWFLKFLRLFINKTMLPTKIRVFDYQNQETVITLEKPFTLLRSKIMVFNGQGHCLGYFKSKLLTLGGGFWIFNPIHRQVGEVKGDWKGWDFKFMTENNQQLGTITKKWAGIGRELFTTADNYVIAADEAKGELTMEQTAMLLAAGLAIDIIFKERK